MTATAFRYFNWVDILVLMLAIKIIYTSLKAGVIAEFFKLCGTIFTVYVSLHYYIAVSDSVRVHMGLKRFPVEFLDFIVFLFLAASSYLSVVFIRIVFTKFMKAQATPRLNRLGGLVLALARGLLLMSLVVFMLAISSIGYLKNSVKRSYFGRDLFTVNIATYNWIWNTFTSKFMVDERPNKTLREVQKGFLGK